MKSFIKSLKKMIFPVAIVVSCFILQLTSIHSYLFFHTIIELFTVIIAFGIFAVTWSSRRFVDNNFLLVLGIGYFFIGGFDLLHALSYKGMSIFEDRSVNLPTQLWIAARYLEAITFIGAALILQNYYPQNRRSNMRKSNKIFLAYLFISIPILTGIFYWDFFPDMYVDGTGSTITRVISEYFIAALFVVAIGLLFKGRGGMDSKVFSLITFSLVLKIISELLYSEYIGEYNFTTMLRHIFKYISFVLIYKATIEIGLMDPYRFLFHNLKKSQEEYRQAQYELQKRIQADLREAYKYIGVANRKMSIILDIEKHSNEKKNKQEIIEYIVSAAKGACHANMALMYKHEEDGRFKLIFGEGVEKNYMNDFEWLDMEKAYFIKNMVKEKGRISSVCDESRPCYFDKNGRLVYFVATPFMVEDECKGFLFLGFEERNMIAQQELEFLDIFSIHISSALMRLKVIRRGG